MVNLLENIHSEYPEGDGRK